MNIKNLITQKLEEEIGAFDCFLVSVRSNEAGTDLRFFIDGVNGVGIQTCAKLSRKISAMLDEEYTEETPIRYEISSPGVDQPLTDKRQYHQHIGRDLEINLGEEKQVEGELLSVSEDDISISTFISKHKKETQTIGFDEIINSNVKISFKRKKK